MQGRARTRLAAELTGPRKSLPTKREREEGSSSSSRDVKPKIEEDVDIKPKIEEDIKPNLEEDVKPSLPTIKDVPLEWLKFADPELLQKLVLQACSSSSELNSLVSSSTAKLAPFISGKEPVHDFKAEIAAAEALIAHWAAEDVWESIESAIQAFDGEVEKDSPLATKLNALKGLNDVLGSLAGELSCQHTESSASDFAGEILKVLNKMTEKEQRTQIDDDLVQELDRWIRGEAKRSLYGKKGRDLGNAEDEDE